MARRNRCLVKTLGRSFLGKRVALECENVYLTTRNSSKVFIGCREDGIPGVPKKLFPISRKEALFLKLPSSEILIIRRKLMYQGRDIPERYDAKLSH